MQPEAVDDGAPLPVVEAGGGRAHPVGGTVGGAFVGQDHGDRAGVVEAGDVRERLAYATGLVAVVHVE